MIKRLVFFITLYLIIAAVAVAVVYTLAPPQPGQYQVFATFIASALTLVASLMTATISLLTLNKQIQAQQTLELLKHRLSIKQQAYDNLYRAAILYYQAFETLQTGKWDEKKVAEADATMQAAVPNLLELPRSVERLWYDYWQSGTVVEDTIAKGLKDQQLRMELWRKHAKDMAERLRRLQNVIRDDLDRGVIGPDNIT